MTADYFLHTGWRLCDDVTMNYVILAVGYWLKVMMFADRSEVATRGLRGSRAALSLTHAVTTTP